MMIRSTRIPYILNRICDDSVVSAILVTVDGELLGASNKCYTSNNNNNNNKPQSQSPTAVATIPSAIETIAAVMQHPESFGTLVADLALDYHRLGDEYATVMLNDPTAVTTTTTTTAAIVANASTGSSNIDQQQQQLQARTPASSSSSISSTMECLLIEMDYGLIGISSSPVSGCFVIVLAVPDAPLGMIQTKLQTVTRYIQESLSVLTTTTTTENVVAAATVASSSTL